VTLHTAPSTRPAPQRPPGSRAGSSWRVPTALIAITIIPLVAGSLRLVEVFGGAQLLPANPRIAASPVPLVLHVVSAAVYAVVGAFQFPARVRRAHRTWHRRAGRVLAGAGLVVAGSGLWMTLFYSGAPGGHLLWTVRVVVSSAMAASLVLGLTAIRRRDIARHRAWMIRAYALGLGAGTQTVTQGVGEGLFGTSDLCTGLSVSAGWVVNALVAEWVVRRPQARRAGRARAARAVAEGS
jgi:uncharacterized membrane protein